MTAFPFPPDPLPTWTCHAGDVAFAISGPSSWLAVQREYLSGFVTFRPGELELGGFTIRAHTDDVVFQQVVGSVARSPVTRHIEPVPGVIMLERAHPSGQRRYVVAVDRVEHQPGAYAVAARGRRLDLFTHSGTRRPHRYPLRLLREAMLRTYEDAGGVVFHAAGVDLGGVGVMICGPRGAGKTTLTAALLRSPDTALLSNDRLIVHGRSRVVAVPLPVPTARGTIEAFPELVSCLHHPVSEPADLDAMPVEFGSMVKHAFTAREFSHALGAGMTSSSTVRLIIVPHLTDTHQPARVRRLRATEAGQTLAANCFTPHDEFWVQPWLVPRQTAEDLLRHHAQATIQHLMTAVPCVQVSFGVRNPLTDLMRTLDKLLGGIQ